MHTFPAPIWISLRLTQQSIQDKRVSFPTRVFFHSKSDALSLPFHGTPTFERPLIIRWTILIHYLVINGRTRLWPAEVRPVIAPVAPTIVVNKSLICLTTAEREPSTHKNTNTTKFANIKLWPRFRYHILWWDSACYSTHVQVWNPQRPLSKSALNRKLN